MSSAHVLIIDDDDASTELLTQLLTSEGASCSMVQNPVQLLAALSRMPTTHIVFLELRMADMDGYEVLNILREYPWLIIARRLTGASCAALHPAGTLHRARAGRGC